MQQRVNRKMLKLDGAMQLRHLVLKKWAYRIVSKGERYDEHGITKWQHATLTRAYVAKFSCPTCDSAALEQFMELRPNDPDEMEWWHIQWSGTCSHIAICSVTNMVACVATPVEEDGVIVGSIEPVSPPEWPRYEGSGDTSVPDRPCAFFGTLWQAMHASLDECRLLAAIQAEGGRDD